MAKRFSPPWTVHSNDDAFWVEDANGNQFAFTYFRADTAGMGPELSRAYHSRDDARRIAVNVAKLPDLLGS